MNENKMQWSGSARKLASCKWLGYISGFAALPFALIASVAVFPVGLLLLVLSVFLIWMGHSSSKQLKTANKSGVFTFDDCVSKIGFTQTREIGDLKIDEHNKKWLIKRIGDIQVHDFSEIKDVEIVQNGESYKSQGGIFRGAVGGAVFGMAGAVVGAATAKKQQSITDLSVVVRLSSLDCPVEKISFISGRTKTDSFVFKTLYESAEKTANTLLAMKDMQ